MAAINGTVTFDNVAVNLVGSGYQFIVSASYLSIDRSNTFSVTAGAEYGLSFSQQPGGAVSNQQFLQPAIASVVDFYGNLIPSSTASITLSAFLGDSEVVFVSGTPTKNAISGLASFGDVVLSDVGSGYSLRASSSGLVSVSSSAFNVVPDIGVAVKLRFKQGTIPAQTDAGSAFAVQPQVELLDFQNQVVITASGSVSVAIKSSTGTANAVLSGTKTVSAVNGVASFSGFGIDRYGSSYVLTATCVGLSSADSNTFRINGAAGISLVTSPTGNVNGTFDALVSVIDEFGQVFPTGALALYLNIKPFSGSSRGVLVGTTRVVSSGGSALFSGVSITIPEANYVLVVSDESNILKAESAAFNVLAPQGQTTKDEETKAVVNSIIRNLADAANVSVDMLIYILFGVAGLVALVLVMSVVQRFRLNSQIRKQLLKKSSKVAPARPIGYGYIPIQVSQTISQQPPPVSPPKQSVPYNNNSLQVPGQIKPKRGQSNSSIPSDRSQSK